MSKKADEKKQQENILKQCINKLVLNSKDKLLYKSIQNSKDPQCPPSCHQYIFKINRNIQITQQVLVRLQTLFKMPKHENIVEVIAKGHSRTNSQAYILSRYFNQSQSLQSLIDKKSEKVTKGDLYSIFYQVINALEFLQRNEINHLRLNPSSILVKLSGEETRNPMVQITDFGIAFEPNYSNQYCLHPEYFTFQNKSQLYGQSFEICRKYDFWALGSIIYYSFEFTRPFQGKSGFFDSKNIFKEKYVVNGAEQWVNEKSFNKIVGKQTWERFLQKCWGIKGQAQFKSWLSAKQFFQNIYPVSEIQKISIQSLIVKHTRLMFLLSKIYLILRQEVKFKISYIFRNEKNHKMINDLSIKLFELIEGYHNLQFKKHLLNRCSILPYNQRKIINEYTKFIESQRIFLQSKSILINKKLEFSSVALDMLNLTVLYKVSIDQQTQYNAKIKILNTFFNELKLKLDQVIKNEKDAHENASNSLYIIYSEVFLKLAVQLGYQFQFPTSSLYSSSH